MQAVSRASCGVPAGQAGEHDDVLVAVAGCGVDRKAEGVSRAAVAQAAQRDLLAAGEHAGDVGEGAAVGGFDPVETGPALPGVG